METGTNLKLQIKIFESAFWIFEVLCINYHMRSVLQSKLLLWFISIFQEVLRWKDKLFQLTAYYILSAFTVKYKSENQFRLLF